MIFNPSFYEKEGNTEKGYDLYSRLLKDRIVLLFHEVNDDLASSIIAQLLYLESVDPNRDICLYINSPGGSVSAGLGIYDTMRKIKCDVSTVCVGMAASMGAFLLAAGTKGKRYALENSQIMIHQLLSGVEGQAADILVKAEQVRRLKERLDTLMAKNTGHTSEEIEAATDRDNWMFPEDALKFGLIDHVITDEA